MKWFKHDSNANMDAKLQDVLLDYGLEGYGLYWYCLELIAAKVDGDNLTFELEHDARIIARNTGSTVQKTQEMMTRFVEIGLFENTEGLITCMKLSRRTDEYTAKIVRASDYLLRTNSGHSPDNVPTLSGQTSEKSLLLDKNRLDKKKSSRFVKPTIDEVKAYFKEKNSTVDPVKFFNHYEAVSWYRGKTKITNWKRCLATWDTPKTTTPPVEGI